MIARAIHYGGQRTAKPFVPISCCAIPPQLVESELFGHEKGAFTGADEKRIGKMQVADGGTLFLDEIGEMPLDAQSKLLRVLQDSCFYAVGSSKVVEVDLRIICATNRNLPEAIQKGIFRSDLFYRVNVLQIEMPPLRQRREDIPALVEYFICKHAPRANARTTEFDPKALAHLASCPWPGNIRELENTIERILVHHGDKEIIHVEDVADLLPPAPGEREVRSELSDLDGLPLEEATRRVERRLIIRALERSDYVQSKAADLLGTTRRILKYKMDQLDIPPIPEENEAGFRLGL
jgi:DNA-binding NtrC family response regulator